MIRAVVGSGGKTTLIKKLANEYRQQGKKVLVTTTTHMFLEADADVSDDADVIIEKLQSDGYVMAGTSDGHKFTALSPETYEKVCAFADEVLVEADGSKRLPFKFPADYEPVIPDNVDEIIVVTGLHSIGGEAYKVIQRLELAAKALPVRENGMVMPDLVQGLLRKGYLEPLKKKYPDKRIVVQPACSIKEYGPDDFEIGFIGESLYICTIAELLKADVDVTLIKESWFSAQPKLIVCGAGHVAHKLVQLASCLDFYIKVIDDREELLGEGRFAGANEVICDSVDNLEKYLEEGAFYVVAGRSHMLDFECVKKIIAHSYKYLGMVGSRRKSANLMDELRAMGADEERIASISTPIGLPINAETPGEIAVSILGQIVDVKNNFGTGVASTRLLEVRETGTLCIIIEKDGSAPREAGTMMYVTSDGVIDTVGGGTVEFEAICDARNCSEVTVKEYNLDSKESRAKGMVCSGSVKILFIPMFR